MASEKKKRKKARKLLRKAQQMEPYRPGQHLSPADLMRRYYGTGVSYTGLSGGGAPGGGGGGGLSALLLEVGKLGGQLNALLSQRKKETTATESMGIPASAAAAPEPAPAPIPEPPTPPPPPPPRTRPVPNVTGMRREREETDYAERFDTQRPRTNQPLVDGVNRLMEEQQRRNARPANNLLAQIMPPPPPVARVRALEDAPRGVERPARRRRTEAFVEDVEEEDGPYYPREGEVPLIAYSAPPEPLPPVVQVPVPSSDALAGMTEADSTPPLESPATDPIVLEPVGATTSSEFEEPVAETGASFLITPSEVEVPAQLPPAPVIHAVSIATESDPYQDNVSDSEVPEIRRPSSGLFPKRMDLPSKAEVEFVNTGSYIEPAPYPPMPTEEDIKRYAKEQARLFRPKK